MYFFRWNLCHPLPWSDRRRQQSHNTANFLSLYRVLILPEKFVLRPFNASFLCLLIGLFVEEASVRVVAFPPRESFRRSGILRAEEERCSAHHVCQAQRTKIPTSDFRSSLRLFSVVMPMNDAQHSRWETVDCPRFGANVCASPADGSISPRLVSLLSERSVNLCVRRPSIVRFAPQLMR